LKGEASTVLCSPSQGLRNQGKRRSEEKERADFRSPVSSQRNRGGHGEKGEQREHEKMEKKT